MDSIFQIEESLINTIFFSLIIYIFVKAFTHFINSDSDAVACKRNTLR